MDESDEEEEEEEEENPMSFYDCLNAFRPESSNNSILEQPCMHVSVVRHS